MKTIDQNTVGHAAHAKPKKLYQQLYVQVLIGVALGIVVGHFWPEFGAEMKPFGDGFVKLVKMMIPPVVFCTIASGIYSMYKGSDPALCSLRLARRS